MTEDHARQPGSDVVSTGSSVDGTLVSLVDVTNNASLELGMRVHLAGQIVSGTLISATQYFRELADVLTRQADEDEDDVARILGQHYASVSESLQEDARRSNEDATLDYPLPEHLHMRDAWAFAPGGDPLVIGLWRGRLSQIAGWAIGSYDTEEPEPTS